MNERRGYGLALTLAALALHAPAHAAVVNQWVQFAPGDTVLIRAIEDTPANGCPAALLDGAPVARSPLSPAARWPPRTRRRRPTTPS